MKNRLGAIVPLCLVLALSACTKQSEAPPAAKAPPASALTPSVVLVADLREAGSECGCGQIIKAVRDAAARGVRTREIDPAKEPDAARPYGILVSPAVGILDSEGKLAQQYVGEDAETLAELKAALAKLGPAKVEGQ